MVIERIRVKLQPDTAKEWKELKYYVPNSNSGLIENVVAYEDALRGEFQDTVNSSTDIKPIIKDIKKLVKKYEGKSDL